MRFTHAVQLLPAYDAGGQLIMPIDYDRLLGGALVHLRFSINKYSLQTGRTTRDRFVAEIERVCGRRARTFTADVIHHLITDAGHWNSRVGKRRVPRVTHHRWAIGLHLRFYKRVPISKRLQHEWIPTTVPSACRVCQACRLPPANPSRVFGEWCLRRSREGDGSYPYPSSGTMRRTS